MQAIISELFDKLFIILDSISYYMINLSKRLQGYENLLFLIG
ncbi:hypothetical protein ENHYDAX1_220320 [Enhydrobacter sp. AX1]|nr:hypothetical protein ENHYDAX1_220320 [Enhydrobacter sp. AX1]